MGVTPLDESGSKYLHVGYQRISSPHWLPRLYIDQDLGKLKAPHGVSQALQLMPRSSSHRSLAEDSSRASLRHVAASKEL